MVRRFNTVLTTLFIVVGAAVAVGLGIVAYRAITTDHRPPPLELADALESRRADAEELLRNREFARAEAYLEKAVELAASDLPGYHDMMGRALLGQPGRLDAAVEQFRIALQLEPAFPEAHNNLAMAYARQGRIDPALAEVREALRLDPDFEAARQNLKLIEAREEGPAVPPGSSPPRVIGGQGQDLARGRAYAKQLYRGELIELFGSFAEALAREMPFESLVQMQRDAVARLGAETELLSETLVPGPGFSLYVRTARFENHDGEIELVVQLNADRKVAGLQFRSANSEP